MTSVMPLQGRVSHETFTWPRTSRSRERRWRPTAILRRMPEPAGNADLVITGADVYTMDAARRWAGAVAIVGDRIAAVGTEPRVRERFPDAKEVLHLPGRMVLPAFQDSHLHAPFAGRYRLHVSLHDLPGVDAYRDAVASYARANPEQPWIFGGGWLMSHFPGGTPTKELLDDLVPDRPVFLLNRDVHGAWVNSKALEVAHITRETPDPWDGRIERDPATGEPTGTLHEGAAYSFADEHLPEPSREEWERAILLAQEHLHCPRHHRMARRLGHALDRERLPLARRTRRAHRSRGRRALVGPAPRSRAGRGARRPSRRRLGRELPPDDREDHVRRRAREPHRRDAPALLRRRGSRDRRDRHQLPRPRPARRSGHRPRP